MNNGIGISSEGKIVLFNMLERVGGITLLTWANKVLIKFLIPLEGPKEDSFSVEWYTGCKVPILFLFCSANSISGWLD